MHDSASSLKSGKYTIKTATEKHIQVSESTNLTEISSYLQYALCSVKSGHFCFLSVTFLSVGQLYNKDCQ